MWAWLGHSHVLYEPAVSKVVTNGNSSGIKVLRLVVFSAQSSVYGTVRHIDLNDRYHLLVIDTITQ